jgi:hypothetical protein
LVVVVTPEQLPEQHSRSAAQATPFGAQDVQAPATQTFEQQSVSVVQVPAFATQQVPLLHVWPEEQLPQLPPQPLSPHVLFVQLGVQHVALAHTWPEEHVVRQVPLVESHARHWPVSQGAARQTEPHA